MDGVESTPTKDAEEAVLSAILIDPKALNRVPTLEATHFAGLLRGRIFAAMQRLDDAGAPMDFVMIPAELARRGQGADEEIKTYLASILDFVSSSAGIQYHAAQVIDLAQRRALVCAFKRALLLAEQTGTSPSAIAADVRSALAPLEATAVGDDLLLLSDEELDALPEPTPLIEGVLFQSTLAAFTGAYGTLKTFVLLDISGCIASGHPWHGHAVQQGAVVYVYAEGANGAKKRLRAWKEAHGITASVPIHFVPMAVKLTDPAQLTKLLAKIKAKQIGPIAAAVIDTANRCMEGNENAPEDMGKFIDGCDRLRKELHATVIVAHHTGWATDRSRGHSSLPGALHTEVMVEREKNDLTVTLKCTKQKDAAEFEPIRLRAYTVCESLAFQVLAPTSTDLSKNELRACHVVLANDGISSTDWMEAAELPKTSYNTVLKRLKAIGYVSSKKKLYYATEALTIAVGAGCRVGAERVPNSRAREVPTPRVSSDTEVAPAPALREAPPSPAGGQRDG